MLEGGKNSLIQGVSLMIRMQRIVWKAEGVEGGDATG